MAEAEIHGAQLLGCAGLTGPRQHLPHNSHPYGALQQQVARGQGTGEVFGGEKIRAELGQAIRLIPGKSEQWLMLAVEGDKKMYFAGSDKPLAMAEVSLYGAADGECYNRLTGKITEILSKILSVPADRIYVRYSETEYWGWNGENF